ncbi:MAG: WG repeat-containing protein [Pyrinomonadaceae bacterium]
MHRTILFLIIFIACATCLGNHPVVAQERASSAAGLLPIMQGWKWGYIDRAGTVVIKPQFDMAGEFSEGLAMVSYGRNLPTEMDDAPSVLFGGTTTLRPVPVDSVKWAFIDPTGKIVIQAPPGMDFMGSGFSGGLAKVSTYVPGKGTLWGYIDKTGKVVIEPKFSYAYWFTEGLAAVCNGHQKCGFIDKSGRYVVPPKYMQTFPFVGDYGFVATAPDTVGFINRAGEMVIQPQFGARVGLGFSEGLSVIAYANTSKYGYIDEQGTLVINPDFDMAGGFSEGLANVQIDGKWGYINKDGKMVIPPQFIDATSFSEGLASVRTDKGCGYIDKAGKFVIEPQYDGGAFPFSGGVAVVMTAAGRGYIDKTGKFIWPPTK